MRNRLYILIIFLFFFRLVYGLCGEFWGQDELQIYLIGLKSYVTNTWPFYGPDIVYSNTQIPGALQGLLVSCSFYLAKIPEAPIVFLNLLSFLSLAFLAWYTNKRIPGVPSWLVWVLIMVTPWTMRFSTLVVNPSYALVFSVPFFIALMELLPIYKKPLLKPTLCFLILGLSTTSIMQLHMSWVLLLPLTGIVFITQFNSGIKRLLKGLSVYILSLVLGALTLIPSLIIEQPHDVSSNIVFNIDNWSNLPIIILRFFALASYEVPYILGGSTAERTQVVTEHIWMVPAAFILLIFGFLQVGLFAFMLFKKNTSEEFKKIKWLVVLSILLIYFSFFFSIKGPSSHTIYIMFPLVAFYSFYCYQWIMSYRKWIINLFKVIAVAGFIFHLGLGLYNFEHKSLYKDRAKAADALEEMDYNILGERRADKWGYGY